MNRAIRFYILCALLLGVVLLGVGWFLDRYPNGHVWVIALAAFFLLPGRISAVYLKDLYRSRRFFDLERYPEAIESGERFLETLKAAPWRRKLIYLTWSLYTWDVEAMVRNNIGASLMMMGRFDGARRELESALALDQGYALPYANLAAMAKAEGDLAESARLTRLAVEKGYSGTRADQLADRVMAIYAQLQANPLEP